jgi:hypothetical protein
MASSTVSRRLRAAWVRTAEVLAAVVMYVAVAVAAVLVLHIVLVFLDANPANAIVVFVRGIADRLVGPFQGLFTPKDPKQQVAIDYGLAAVVYLAAGAAVTRVIRLLGGRFAR